MTQATLAPAAELHVHRLFARYAGLPVGVVTQCAANHASLLHDAWHPAADRAWEDNARALFERCDDYMYELLHAATTRLRQKDAWCSEHVWPHLLAAGPRVLDFGGGLGLASSLLAAVGKQVTYLDVEGPAARFAAWYFAAAGQAIEQLRTPAARTELPAGRQWDVVLVEHVLEHVADPVATVEVLARAVAPGGLLHLRLVAGERVAGPLARPVELTTLLAGSRTLRAMAHPMQSDDGNSLFRAI